jgi:hypothetical protein
MPALSTEALEQLFINARTHNAFRPEPIPRPPCGSSTT